MDTFGKSGKTPVRPHSGASARRAFALYAWLSIGIYAIFCVYFSFGYSRASYFLRDLSNIVLVPGLSVLLFAYWRGYFVLKEQPSLGAGRVFFFGAATALVALLIPDFYSSDLLGYVNYGWQQAAYHINPYVLMLVATPGFGTDPMFTKIWELNAFPYGFTFAHITRLVCQLGHGDLQLTVRLFKCLNFSVFLALAVLIYIGAKRLKLPRPDLSLYLFMGSPLLLLHDLSNVHNDIIMVLFVMLSFFFMSCSIFALVLPFLIIGALVKYLWLFALPFFLLYLFRRAGWKAVAVNLFTGSLTFACLAWGYIGDWRNFQWQVIKHNLDVNANSLPAVIFNLARATEQVIYRNKPLPGFDEGLAAFISATKQALFVSFVAFAVWLLYKAFRNKSSYTLSRVIEICVLGTMIAAFLVASKVYPWYVIMFFPVALWLPQRSEVRRLAVTLSCTQLFAITFLGHGHVLNVVLLTGIPFALSFLRWRKTERRRA
jgi:hypothetical protein